MIPKRNPSVYTHNLKNLHLAEMDVYYPMNKKIQIIKMMANKIENERPNYQTAARTCYQTAARTGL